MTMTQPQQDWALVGRASDIATLAGRHADKAEAARTPDPVVAAAVVAAGFARHFVPQQFGGSTGTFAELKQAATTIGAECPATAWCAVLAALMARAAGALPAEGQALLWAGGPDVLIAGGVTPRGTATAVDGGWLLSGAWPTVSGSEGADWVLLAAAVHVAGGRADRVCLVPRSAVRIERSWDSIGMQGTGSHTVVVDQVFVPGEMTFSSSLLGEIDSAPVGPDGRAVPLLAVNTLIFCLPMLGAAHGALRQWQRLIGAKMSGRHVENDPALAHYAAVFARSSSEIDTAGLILDRVVMVADSAAIVGRTEVARNQRDCAFAAGLLVDAVDRLFRASGTSGHSAGVALQRFWRDIHTAGAHAALQFDTAAAAYAREGLTAIV
ncbi:hydrolase [Nocardia sp. NBC_01327]|uniref:hydrolase n=1 Tax=Nocardia sp. NBC_01327 TaxID=2903593 RepID=UPI002E15056F|nr:hydrolase [Nocardia sp. NBC_01327]